MRRCVMTNGLYLGPDYRFETTPEPEQLELFEEEPDEQQLRLFDL